MNQKKPAVAILSGAPQVSRIIAEMQAHGLLPDGQTVPAAILPAACGQGAGKPCTWIEEDFLLSDAPLSVQ